MSGGYFNYSDFKLELIADDIQQVILENRKTPSELSGCEFEWDFRDETIKKFHEAILLLKLARTYVHRIDYLLEGDDGEETFHERLAEDLEKIEAIPKLGGFICPHCKKISAYDSGIIKEIRGERKM